MEAGHFTAERRSILTMCTAVLTVTAIGAGRVVSDVNGWDFSLLRASRCSSDRSMKLPTHLHVLPRFIMCGSLPLRNFIALCLGTGQIYLLHNKEEIFHYLYVLNAL